MMLSQSLPNIGPIVVEPSDFLKTYSKLSEARSSAQRAVRLNHLKNARIRSVDEDEYNRVIRHLEDVINVTKFQRLYIELYPRRSVTGFLETGEHQYFTVTMGGAASPLNFDVKRDKGAVVSYFSFRSLKPGPDIHDYKFKSRNFKITSRFSTFREPKGCLCILAERETNVTVKISFGVDDGLLREGLIARRSILVTNLDAEEGGTSILSRSHVSREPSERPSDNLSQTINFIEANKAIRLKTPTRLRTLNESRQLQTKLRRLEKEASNKERVADLAEKVERRQEALAQAKYISQVIKRKVKFEKEWLRLIFFAEMSFQLHSRFIANKIATIRLIRRSYACYRFQRVYRNLFPEGFEIKCRLFALAVNHFKLEMSACQLFVIPEIQSKLYTLIHSSYMNSRISQAIRVTYSHILIIQRNWHRKRIMENYYFRHIYDLWDRAVMDEELKWQKEYQRRKKCNRKKHRRFIVISEEAKMNFVKIALRETKEKHRNFHRSLERRCANLIAFLPSYEEVRAKVLSLAVEGRRRKPLCVPSNVPPGR